MYTSDDEDPGLFALYSTKALSVRVSIDKSRDLEMPVFYGYLTITL